MNRVLEPEVMDGAAQALAYARADFSDVNQMFVDDFLARYPDAHRGRIVDLGCGPGDIALRLSARAPAARVLGIDAAPSMLRLAAQAIRARGAERVAVVCAWLPEVPVPDGAFDAVISNSLVHHLPDPAVFWTEARRLARRAAPLYVQDLFRPSSPEEARAIVDAAAADEDPILQDDFFNSLLAAFEPAEVRAQLSDAGLSHLRCDVVSDRHWLVTGRL